MVPGVDCTLGNSRGGGVINPVAASGPIGLLPVLGLKSGSKFVCAARCEAMILSASPSWLTSGSGSVLLTVTDSVWRCDGLTITDPPRLCPALMASTGLDAREPNSASACESTWVTLDVGGMSVAGADT